MRYYLVTYFDNWSDEFDIEGFVLQTEDELQQMFDAARSVSYPSTLYFGTNEFVEYESFEDWRDHLDIKEITKEVFEEMTKLGIKGFGTFLNPEG
jgi:hypothetical protein